MDAHSPDFAALNPGYEAMILRRYDPAARNRPISRSSPASTLRQFSSHSRGKRTVMSASPMRCVSRQVPGASGVVAREQRARNLSGAAGS